jgi:hypothetical protein
MPALKFVVRFAGVNAGSEIVVRSRWSECWL